MGDDDDDVDGGKKNLNKFPQLFLSYTNGCRVRLRKYRLTQFGLSFINKVRSNTISTT